MNNGMDIFRERFKDFGDNYIIVGGTACQLIMNDYGQEFRKTKDIDMIIIIENMNKKFEDCFFAFLRDGEYECYKNKEGEQHYFRFSNPKNKEFPYMIELFAKKNINITNKILEKYTAIDIEDNEYNLSGILLDNSYYNFLLKGKIRIKDVSILDKKYIVPFKAKAHVDININCPMSGDKRKHKNDICRLLTLFSDYETLDVDDIIKKDLKMFINMFENDYSTENDILRVTSGVYNKTEIIEKIKKVYNL